MGVHAQDGEWEVESRVEAGRNKSVCVCVCVLFLLFFGVQMVSQLESQSNLNTCKYG